MESLLPLAQKIVIGAGIILAALVISRLVRTALAKTLDRFEWSAQIGPLIASFAYYAILVLGVMVGVSMMGIDITPVVAALGLGGFALGFALRDAISNLLAGILIIVYRPFSIGDNISVGGDEGEVAEINLRYTVLINNDGKTLVPNQKIISQTVKIKKRD
ncbi:hypothetical protein MNBD_NITROSPINAE02-1807 [hydrothermal vent metagenome]|uniref:Small-conductance mechanosensitive channel n=1 Tax=hydrothermal vent metagenome TaxID=652676 RepID=A0A3B1CIH7_9ZZZZ